MNKVLLLLANGFEFYEASAFIDVMGWNLLEGDRSTKLFTCGLTEEVKSTFDQRVIVDFTIDEIEVEDFAALAISGGFEEFGFYQEAYSEELSGLIRDLHAAGKPIASICTGALPIAKSGILRGKEGTAYNQNPLRLSQLREFGVKLSEQPIVEAGNIITSRNPSTALGVAFLLLRRLTSIENSERVQALMGISAHGKLV